MTKKDKKSSNDSDESLKPFGSPSKKSKSLKIPKSSGDTTKSSSQKPQLKIVRNNMGSIIIIFFGILFDLYIFIYSTYYTYKFGLLKGQSFVGPEKYILFASFVAFVTSIFSIIFSFAILSVSSLTMQKQKRLKLLPYLVFAFFKLTLHFWQSLYLLCLGLLIKDLLLYSCMSNTAKNQIVRRFFKPYKQVVVYE